jgi:hypothetical protein
VISFWTARADSVVGSETGAEGGMGGVSEFDEICAQMGASLRGGEMDIINYGS